MPARRPLTPAPVAVAAAAAAAAAVIALVGCTQEPSNPQTCRFLCDSTVDATHDAKPETARDAAPDAPPDGADGSVDQPRPDTTIDAPRADSTRDSTVDAPRADSTHDATVDAPLFDSTRDASVDGPPPDTSADSTLDAPVPPDGAPPLGNGVSTLAGWSYSGNQDGTRFDARFDNPANVLCAANGNIYIADYNNGQIRVSTPAGVVTTLTAPGAFSRPFGMALGANGKLYVESDYESTKQAQVGAIWEVDTSSGVVTLVLDQSGRARGLVPLPDGRIVMIQYLRHFMQILDPATKTVTFLAGANGIDGFADGTGVGARFYLPYDGVLDANGDVIVTDTLNHVLRKVTLAGVVTTYAGDGAPQTFDGTLTTASFYGPQGLARDAAGNLYVSETLGYVLRKIDTTGQVTTIAGDGSAGVVDAVDPLHAEFYGLEGIDVTPNGKIIYVSDGDRGDGLPFHRVRRVAFP